MDNKPWINEDGTLKSTEELKRCSQNWKPSAWEEYLSSLPKNHIKADFWSEAKIQSISEEYYKKAIEELTRPSDLKHFRDHIQEALEVLTPVQKLVIKQAYWNGKPYSEIAEELGVGKSTVQIHMERALKKLKKAILKIHNNDSEKKALKNKVAEFLAVMQMERTTKNIKYIQELKK